MNKKTILFFILLAIFCPVLYVIIIKYIGSTNSGSIFILALMWMPAIAAFISKLIFDHTLKGIGWKIKGFQYIGIAYIVPPLSCILVYGLAWVKVFLLCRLI